MTITLLAFYLFSITAVMSALFVVVARKPCTFSFMAHTYFLFCCVIVCFNGR